MMCRFIGLIGHAGSGKDTAAEYLANTHGYRRIAFGDELKYYLGLAKGFRGSRSEIIEQVNTHKVRDELISYGMAFREMDLDTWVNALDKRIQRVDRFYRELRAPLPKWTITDIRFENELNLVRNKLHGVIIKVTAPLDVRIERMQKRGDQITDWSFTRHKSETFVDTVKPDYVVDNSGSFEDLARQLSDIMQRIR